MKKVISFILSVFLLSITLCGCKKETESLSNPYQPDRNESNNIYGDTPLSYSEGFSSKIAVVGKDAVNSEGSENLKSEAALLVDATTGEVLFQKNPHKKEYPASTTKILTSLLALKYGDTSASRKVGDEVIINEDNVILCDFRYGDTISFELAMHATLLRSGNDAAAFLSLFVADNLNDFAELMNKEAKKLGATESHFVNPHGLFNENHYTTAYDLYLIFNEAIKYTKFVDTISCRQYDGSFTRKTSQAEYLINCSYSNTNQYVTGALPTPEGIKVLGGKAGYTEAARRSYVMLAEANEHRYIIITMRADNSDDMYHDLTALLNKIPVNKKNYADNE